MSKVYEKNKHTSNFHLLRFQIDMLIVLSPYLPETKAFFSFFFSFFFLFSLFFGDLAFVLRGNIVFYVVLILACSFLL